MMNIEKDAKELARKFKKYRTIQERRVALMKQAIDSPEKKKKGVDYKKKVISMLSEVNALLKEMDVISARILDGGKQDKAVKSHIDAAVTGNKQNLIN